MPISYVNLDIAIEHTANGYHAEITDSPGGQASGDFALPFSDLELENYMLRLGASRRGMRRVDSPETEAAKTFGSKLFNAVFTGDLRACLVTSQNDVEGQGMGLRVRLRLTEAPELADLPWEYLYNSSLNRFLALSIQSPLVRYLDLPERIRPLAVKPPLSILAMIASPTDFPQLDVEAEFSRLSASLREVQARGLVKLERLDDASLPTLVNRLQDGEYHILHLVGHGVFDDRTQQGMLVLEDEQHRGRLVSAEDLGTILHDHISLRLAVLNACEGARTSRTDPFAGAAQSLVQQGIPAVIAMQFEISDDAAITFSQSFYGALVHGYPVDGALGEARKAIFAQGNELEWGTPVLYMRAPDGKIFDVQSLTPAEQSQAERQAQATLPPAQPAPGSDSVPPPSDSRRPADKVSTIQADGAGAAAIPGQPHTSLLSGLKVSRQMLLIAGAVVVAVIAIVALLVIQPWQNDNRNPAALLPLSRADSGHVVFIGGPRGNGQAVMAGYDIAANQVLTIPVDTSKFQGGFFNAPVLSHDGKKIAFDAVIPGSKWRVFTIGVDGTGLTQLAGDGAWSDEAPAWSPDDTRIVFARSANGASEVYMMDANGDRQQQLTRFGQQVKNPSWSANGQQIAFSLSTNGRSDIYTLLASGNATPQKLVADNDADDRDPVWSPRHETVAFTSQTSTRTIVRIVDVATQRVIDLPCPEGKFCTTPAWAPHGNYILFVVTDKQGDQNGDLYYTDPSGRYTLNRLAGDIYANIFRPTWGP